MGLAFALGSSICTNAASQATSAPIVHDLIQDILFDSMCGNVCSQQPATGLCQLQTGSSFEQPSCCLPSDPNVTLPETFLYLDAHFATDIVLYIGRLRVSTAWNVCQGWPGMHWTCSNQSRATPTKCRVRWFACSRYSVFMYISQLLQQTDDQLNPLECNCNLAQLYNTCAALCVQVEFCVQVRLLRGPGHTNISCYVTPTGPDL